MVSNLIGEIGAEKSGFGGAGKSKNLDARDWAELKDLIVEKRKIPNSDVASSS